MVQFVLSENDRNDLKAMLTDWRNSRGNVPLRSPSLRDIHQAPEHYIAKPQSAGGIPALVRGPPDLPGVATCDIYRITIAANGDPELTQIVSLNKQVYNLSQGIVAQDWIPATRDKSGKYIAANTGRWILDSDDNAPVPGGPTINIDPDNTLKFTGSNHTEGLTVRDNTDDLQRDLETDTMVPVGIVTRARTDSTGAKHLDLGIDDEVIVCAKLLAVDLGEISHTSGLAKYGGDGSANSGTLILFDDAAGLNTFNINAGTGIKIVGGVLGEAVWSITDGVALNIALLGNVAAGSTNPVVIDDHPTANTLGLTGGKTTECAGSSGGVITHNFLGKFLVDAVGTGTSGDYIDFEQHANPHTVELIGGTGLDIVADVANGRITFDNTGMRSFNVLADSGFGQAITQGDVLKIFGGTGISTTTGPTDTVNIILDRPPFQVRLSSILEPGGSSPANFLVWNVTTSAYDATGAQLTVWDTHFRNFGFSGETFDVVLDPDSGRYEVKGSQLPTLTCVTDATIVAGTQGIVSVWKDGVDTGLNLSAWLDWAVRTGEDVSASKEGVITYRPDWARWDLTILECEDDELNEFNQMYSFIA